jgi:mannose-6-phosphate isomerase
MSIFTEEYLRFAPIYQSRVWGGRRFESLLGRTLPDTGTPYGESWEISARPEADCVVVTKESFLAGQPLSKLWKDRDLRRKLFGENAPDAECFPLLCKILDARERLSLQVHPPADVAPVLGGEPKTEVWVVAAAEPGAKLYIGLREGVGEEDLRAALESGTAEDLVHQIAVRTGDVIFIPSGRLHAIGEGLLIYEIQQNSDTTYRVYDWNRPGLDGQPRALHVEESLRCIDFNDVEPIFSEVHGGVVAVCPHFQLERHCLSTGEGLGNVTGGRFAIITVVEGVLQHGAEQFTKGDFFLVPSGSANKGFEVNQDSTILLTTWGS